MSNTQNQGNLKLKTADLTFADILTGDPVQKQEAQAEAHSRHYKEQLALKLIDYARDELIIHLPYFNRAILKMPVRFYEPKLVEEDIVGGFATNTKEMICDPDLVIRMFEDNPVKLSRLILHTVFHCLYQHTYRYEVLHKPLWDLACDVAVEREIMSLGIGELRLEKDTEREVMCDIIRKKCHKMNAEVIYTHMINDKTDAADWLERAQLFKRDTHTIWASRDTEFYEGLFLFDCNENEIDQAGAEWSRIFENVKKDKDVLEQGFGISPGSVTDYIGSVTGDDYDYSEFLMRFAKITEEVKVNNDEFDYIYYTYGLKEYGNMPLIEPLEYKESLKIYDFVIAIDTSGSCRGRVVKNFLKRTYSILKKSEVFGTKMNVHIIQCDNQIQDDAEIISDEAFERYIQNVNVTGSGGTDFRPVFQHVERMRKGGVFSDLRGLLYFTDGLGIFPEKEPKFKTAFIIMPQEDDIPQIPDWVIGRMVSRDDLDE